MLGAGMHPLTDRALENLVALTRLLGTVRFFHRTAVPVDWSALIRAGVLRAEPAADSRQLAEVLEELIRPLAPGVEPSADAQPAIRLQPSAPAAIDRTLRLAILVEAWPVFQHFYPYWDAVSTDWEAALRTALRSAAVDPDEESFLRTLRRFVAGLDDGHGDVHRAAVPLFRPPVAWDWIDGHLAVLATDPASAVPLRRGDVVRAIDGVPSAEALAAEEELTSAATPHSRRRRALTALAAGRPGSEVHLYTSAGPPLTLRRSLPLHACIFDPTLPAPIAEVRPGLFYVDLRRATGEGFERALGPLSAARGIVFDLRGQPTASKSFLQHLTDHPLRSPCWDRQDATWTTAHWTLDPALPRLRGSLAFLANAATISYAETLLGIVEHHRLGEIVGAPTAGTNGDVAWLHLPAGLSLRWTALRVRKPDGTRHHGVGIQPTVAASPTLEGVRAGRDEVLERGIEVVSLGVGGK
jgi:Peptidase family S41